MKMRKDRGLIGLLLVLIVALAIVGSVEYTNYHDQPGGFTKRLEDLWAEAKDFWLYLTTNFDSLKPDKASSTPADTASWQKFESQKYGFSINYPDKDLVKETHIENQTDNSMPLDQFSVTEKSTLNEIRMEGPAEVSISIFSNSKKLSALEWARGNIHSNFNPSVKYEMGKFGGVDALTYAGDGLYAYKFTVISRNNYIIFIANAYTDLDNLNEHEQILSTFRLIN